MKKRLCALLALSVCLCALSGCSGVDFSWFTDQFQPDDETIQQQTAAAPITEAPAEQYVSVTTAAPEEISSFSLAYQSAYGLNPYNCEGLNNRVIFSFLYEPLFAVSSSFEAVPVLAEGWEVSDDGLTTTVHLHTGVSFHDGSAMTATDVVYSLETARGSSYYGSRLYHVATITAADESTVVLTTGTAYECLPLLLDIPIIKNGADPAANPIGTGPYKFASADRLTRFIGWWQSSAPLVDFDFISLSDVDTTADIRDAFEYGQADLVRTDPNSLAYAGFHNDYEVWNAPSTILHYIGYNLTSSVFSNYGLRSAITYAIDRDAIVSKDFGGFAEKAVLPASPQAPYYDVRLANSYDYSLSSYNLQLQSASVEDMDGDGILDLYVSSLGYAVPVSGTMIVCGDSYQNVQAATDIVSALNELGFDLTLESMDYDSYKYALSHGNYELYYGEVRLSANFDLSQFFRANGTLDFGGLADSTMDNLCELALANNGNTYNLYKRLCERGYLTPILVKSYAIYTTRGAVSNPAAYLDWFLPAQSETAE